MMITSPIIDPDVCRLAPGFRAVSVSCDATGLERRSDDADVLAEACRFAANGGPAWAEDHFSSWAEVYSRFGAKPPRTPNSAHALRKRVLKDATVPRIDPLVDLYNAASLRFALPIGGEDMATYKGSPRLTIANGSERFETMANGEPVVESPEAGEVVWRDDDGVTCRRWNWRQGKRTRLHDSSRSMWFVLESLETMPLEALEDAGQFLEKGLHRILPGCTTHRETIVAARPQI